MEFSNEGEHMIASKEVTNELSDERTELRNNILKTSFLQECNSRGSDACQPDRPRES